jgi:hypothetical protein
MTDSDIQAELCRLREENSKLMHELNIALEQVDRYKAAVDAFVEEILGKDE